MTQDIELVEEADGLDLTAEDKIVVDPSHLPINQALSVATVGKVKQTTIGDEVINQVNGGTTTELVEELASSHRYLQREIFNGVVKQLIMELAENPSDARNEKAVSQCRDIVDHMGWE
mgnify:CR=1 FL=1